MPQSSGWVSGLQPPGRVEKVIPMKHRSYSATNLGHVDLRRLMQNRQGCSAVLGMDVSKSEVLMVIRWSDGRFERPWKMKNPGQIPELTGMLQELGKERKLTVALEPTGVYGDALRQALADAGQVVHRVSPKAAHDWAEVFDGVPSQHDGKDAAIVAELCALGKSKLWEHHQPSESEQEMAMLVDWMDAQRRLKSIWTGRIEAILGRHWPEALAVLKCSSGTLLRSLERWGGPKPLAEDPQARQRIAGWGGKLLSEAKVTALLESAHKTVGVRQGKIDLERVKRHAREARAACGEVARCQRELKKLAMDNPVIQSQGPAIGVPTACVLWVCIGDPREYHCAAAYRKAMGLNLAERSSGRYQGKLKISKRGSAMARHWLHLAALRLIRSQPSVRGWYEAKKERDVRGALGAVTGVTRRLAMALHAIAANGEAFDPMRLFPKGKGAGRRKGEAATVGV